jgi:uncharacterized protein YukE
MAVNQIRAEFGTIDQLAADQGAYGGDVEGVREALRTQAMNALGVLDGGMGTEEHQACMTKVDELIDEYIRETQQMQRSTNEVGQTFLAGGTRARGILGSGTT